MTSKTPEHDKTSVIKLPEAVGVFDSLEAFRAAFYDLRMVGFSRYDISILGDEKVLKEKLGQSYWRSDHLEDNPDVPRAAFVSEEAVGELEGALVGGFFFLGSFVAMAAMLTPASTVAASIAAIAIGGSPSAALGAILARRVGKHHQGYYETQIKHGGILLWVRVKDKEKQELAVKILKGHSGHDVHVHDWSL